MGTPSSITISSDYDIVLFDGHCNLCNQAIQFIIRHDVMKRFRFASLQSVYGHQQLKKMGIVTGEPFQTIVLIRDAFFFERSDAALEIVKHLNGLWPFLYNLKVIPRYLRDPIYNIIARYRYIIFGRQKECMIPTDDLVNSFLG